MFRRILIPAACGIASVLPAAASEEGGGAGSLLITPQFGTIFWTVVTFVLLALGLRLVAWKPLLGAIEERERTIRESLEAASRQREEAESLLAEHRELVVLARKERAAAVEAGRQDAEALKNEILEEGRRQREQLLKQADTQIGAAVKTAREELRSATVDLAIEAAGKLLAKNLDDAAQRRLIEDYLADLERRGTGSSPPS